MTTKIGRLKRRIDFLRMRGGPRWAVPSLVLEGRRRGPEEEEEEEEEGGGALARFGFTSSKGAVGGAVERNRARRRLKEAVRLIAPMFAREGYDYVLIARPGTLQRPFAELLKDLQTAFDKVHQRGRGKSAPRSSPR